MLKIEVVKRVEAKSSNSTPISGEFDSSVSNPISGEFMGFDSSSVCIPKSGGFPDLDLTFVSSQKSGEFVQFDPSFVELLPLNHQSDQSEQAQQQQSDQPQHHSEQTENLSLSPAPAQKSRSKQVLSPPAVRGKGHYICVLYVKCVHNVLCLGTTVSCPPIQKEEWLGKLRSNFQEILTESKCV